MSRDHPQNGPNHSKAPAKKGRRVYGAPSPSRQVAEEEEAKRDAVRMMRSPLFSIQEANVLRLLFSIGLTAFVAAGTFIVLRYLIGS
jgi:hypothetical protein